MSEPLYSSYADDEDMRELVEMFVMELPAKVSALETAIEGGNIDQLTVYAHQLKGSAGSYGFTTITEAAATFETCLKGAETDTAVLRECAASLIDLMNRATAEPQT